MKRMRKKAARDILGPMQEEYRERVEKLSEALEERKFLEWIKSFREKLGEG